MQLSPLSSIFLLALPLLSSAQSTTSSSAPVASGAITPANSVNAVIYPGDSTYAYYGCYNETTLINGTAHLRALDGVEETADTMTVETCLKFCDANGADAFAGLEYTRLVFSFQFLLLLVRFLKLVLCILLGWYGIKLMLIDT